MKRLLREPFAHFLALGTALFALYAWRAKAPAGGSRIEVTAAVVERLRAGWERQFGRVADEETLRDLVAAHVREEVLYREALALGLDRDDTIVRRRMAQKMEFLTDDVAAAAGTDEDALRAFFDANAARYARPARTTFRHVYFSTERRGAHAARDAAEALAAVQAGASDAALGDPFLHGDAFTGREPADVEALFGPAFAADVASQAGENVARAGGVELRPPPGAGRRAHRSGARRARGRPPARRTRLRRRPPAAREP
jgi:hypothetical protein